MVKISYSFTALDNIHTGSDLSLGTLKTLRRDKVVGVNKSIHSKIGFSDKDISIKHNLISLLIYNLWQKIHKKNRYTIYDELAGKLFAASYSKNKHEFISRLASDLDIRNFSEPNGGIGIIQILDLFSDTELLNIIRNDSMYIVALFRNNKDIIIKQETESGNSELRESIEQTIALFTTQSEFITNTGIDYIPTISGNSIRGLLRRLAMYDFCKIVGLDNLSSEMYHRLFTGGVLSNGDGFEDIAYRENFIRNCPMIGLFGAAIGKQTIQGELRVGQAKLKCIENGNGIYSYHDLIQICFNTRLDSSKAENCLSIIGNDETTHQMIYNYEVFCRGTEFEHNLSCVSDSKIITNAFHKLLRLFVGSNYIAAKSNIGLGEIDLSELERNIDNQQSDLYMDYLIANTEQIKAFFKCS